MKVFLGGTCNDSMWRDGLMPFLEEDGIDYFNPVVKEWNEKAREEENKQKKECDICLYVFTSKMTGMYAIAEATEAICKYPDKVLCCILEYYEKERFDPIVLKSLKACAELWNRNAPGRVLHSSDSMITNSTISKRLLIYKKQLESKGNLL